MNLAIAVAGTFLYQGPYFAGGNGQTLCQASLQQTLQRMQQVGLRAVAASCAPIQTIGSPNFVFEVQILVGGQSNNIRRYNYRSGTACNISRDRLLNGATQAALPWINAFCDQNGLQFDVISTLQQRINWDIALGSFESESACQLRADQLNSPLAQREQGLIFTDCEAIQDINDRLQFRLRFATRGPQPVVLGTYDEIPYDSPTACAVGALEVDAALDTNGRSTSIHHCQTVRNGVVARHLVLDTYPSRFARENALAYPTESRCLEAYPSVWGYLESQRHVPFSYRCIPQNESYRLFIDYLRAQPVVASTPGESPPLPR